MPSEDLTGGRRGISLENGIVTRPASKWTATVHQYLNSIGSSVSCSVPRPVSLDEGSGKEKLGFVPGDSHNYPLPPIFYTDEMRVSAAISLKILHDAFSTFLSLMNTSQFEWMLDPASPQEVICHGDFAPYNVSIDGSRVVGVFVFDTIHPGPAIRDVAYAAYRFAPVMCSEVPSDRFCIAQVIRRVKLFVISYGVSFSTRDVFEAMINRLHSHIQFMKKEADNGNEAFTENIKDGHMESYFRDIELIKGILTKLESADSC